MAHPDVVLSIEGASPIGGPEGFQKMSEIPKKSLKSFEPAAEDVLVATIVTGAQDGSRKHSFKEEQECVLTRTSRLSTPTATYR